jgi:WD40 repeat protein/tetratricopeptide (TPR) repeat protein
LPGQSGQSALSESGRQYWQSVARIGIQVAEALAYAHSQGTLHRDIKPSNLLLDTHGTVWVTDFGLAKAADSVDLTNTGDIVGTLRYMAPERFQAQADQRGDIYGLGLTLYELLTLRGAFQASDRNQLIDQVKHAEPPRPRKLNAEVPRDLETIVLKAMAKEPAHRYATAGDLADDLKRFVEDRPIKARPVGGVERLWRWCRRNPALATASGLAVVGLLAALIVAVWFGIYQAEAAQDLRTALGEVQSKEQKLTAALKETERERDKAASRLAENYLDRGLVACRNDRDVARGLLWMVKALEAAPKRDENLRWIIRTQLAAWQNEVHPLTAVLTHKGEISAVAFSPDGKAVLTGSADHTARLWSAATGKELTPPLRHQGEVYAVAFSPDGKTVLTGSWGGTINKPWGEARLWSSATGQELTPPLRFQGIVRAVALSPDGKAVLTGSEDGTARLWSAATGKELTPPLRHKAEVLAVVFSPDGKAVLTASADHTARLWSVATGKPLTPPLEHQGLVHAVALSPDGKAILAGSHDGTAWLWSAASCKELTPPLRHQGGVFAVAFSPDGKAVLTGSADKTARLWSAATGKEVVPPCQHQDSVDAVAFSPDGKAVLTSSRSQVLLWLAATGQPLGNPLLHPDTVHAVAFSPDGKAVITTSQNTARLWSVAITQPLSRTLRHQLSVHAVAFSPDGKALLTGCYDKTARLWSAVTGKELIPPLRHQATVNAVAFSPDGKTVLTGSGDQTARLWSAATGKELTPPLRHQGDVAAVAFSPDGKALFTGSGGYINNDRNNKPWGEARLWSAATGQELTPPLRHQDKVNAVAFSPDGKAVLTGTGEEARLWSSATGKELTPPLHHQGYVSAVAFSPDSKVVLTGCYDKTARLWSAATGRELTLPLRHQDAVTTVAFSPDGKAVLTGSGVHNTGEARLWSAATGQELRRLRHRGGVTAVAFSPDGKVVLTGSGDKTARLWSVATGQPLGPPLRHPAGIKFVAFSPDGKAVLTGSEDETVRLWLFPVPVIGKAEPITLWVQTLVGAELDHQGVLHVLDAKAWQERRNRLLKLGGAPLSRKEPDLPRHSQEAAEAEIRKQWFAVAWHLGPLIKAKPREWSLRLRRGRAYAELGQWDKASADFAKAAETNEATETVFLDHGLLRLQLADQAGYRRACARMLERFGRTEDAETANSLAWACVLGPHAVADLDQPVKLAEKAVGQANSREHLTTLGAALYRAGKLDAALRRLNEAIKVGGKGGDAFDWLFLAMAHHRLGHAKEASLWLQKAVKDIDDPRGTIDWDHRLTLQLLRREAEALIQGKAKAAKK